jgi:hypothetical protein
MRCFQHRPEVGSKPSQCKNNCLRLSKFLCEVMVRLSVFHEAKVEVWLSCSRNSPAFTEPETRSSMSPSLEPSTGSCRYTLHNLIYYFFKIH